MSNEQAMPNRDEQGMNAAEQPWQGEWPGTGPAPTEGEVENVEEQIAEGKWSESRQRVDFTGVNQADVPPTSGGQEQEQSQGAPDVAQQVRDGTESPS